MTAVTLPYADIRLWTTEQEHTLNRHLLDLNMKELLEIPATGYAEIEWEGEIVRVYRMTKERVKERWAI